VLATKGASLGGQQDDFAIIPITTALNRYGRWWDDMTILVQARDGASYDDCIEQVRGILRAVRKVPPGAPDDFELFFQQFAHRTIQNVHPRRARGRGDCQFHRAHCGGHRHHEHHAGLGHGTDA
jgi:hypothetical protein